MKKIPTLFVRDPDDRAHVTDEVTPGCEWVLKGEGAPTRKYDGTCILIRRDGLTIDVYARREVKPGKADPPHFVLVEEDEVTGKRFGWEPAVQSGFGKFIDEALATIGDYAGDVVPGTYELCGPKINGNPEGLNFHHLIPHGRAVLPDAPRDFAGLRAYLLPHSHEGIVWWHDDGRMAKLKRRDFRPVNTKETA